MIVLNVTYKCKTGMRDTFLEKINAEGIGEACRAEDGCEKYDYYIPCFWWKSGVMLTRLRSMLRSRISRDSGS